MRFGLAKQENERGGGTIWPQSQLPLKVVSDVVVLSLRPSAFSLFANGHLACLGGLPPREEKRKRRRRSERGEISAIRRERGV